MTEVNVDANHSQVVIAKITGVYGIKGWVKIHSFTEPMENFIGFVQERGCVIEGPAGSKALAFDQVKRHGKGLVGHITGVDDRDKAALFAKSLIKVDSTELPDLGSDEFYWHQLEGLSVVIEAEKDQLCLGKVDHLLETGANDVLVVKACKGSIDDQERLIPYLPEQVIKQVDIKSGHIVVDWDPEF